LVLIDDLASRWSLSADEIIEKARESIRRPNLREETQIRHIRMALVKLGLETVHTSIADRYRARRREEVLLTVPDGAEF